MTRDLGTLIRVMARKRMTVIVYDKEYGEIQRHKVAIGK